MPSRKTVLAKAKAQAARQRTRKKVLGATVSVLCLAATLWTLDPAWRTDDLRTGYVQPQRARFAAQLHITSRLHALALLPKAAKSPEASPKPMLRHALGGWRS